MFNPNSLNTKENNKYVHVAPAICVLDLKYPFLVSPPCQHIKQKMLDVVAHDRQILSNIHK